MLQPWVVLAAGSAVIHCTYTSPVSGSNSIPLGIVLQNDCAWAIPFCARTSTEGPNVCPPFVRSCDVDLTGGKIVIADVNLILVRRRLARENGQPWPVDKRRIDCGEIVDGPS